MLEAAAKQGLLMDTSLDRTESMFPGIVRNLMLELDGERLIDGVDLDPEAGAGREVVVAVDDGQRLRRHVAADALVAGTAPEVDGRHRRCAGDLS